MTHAGAGLCVLMLALALAGCGADGAPEAPPSPPDDEEQSAPRGTVTITGSAGIGVVGGSGSIR